MPNPSPQPLPQPSWLDLHELLQKHVRPGTVIFYAELAMYFCGSEGNNGPVREMIQACAANGKMDHLHRIVKKPTKRFPEQASLLGIYPQGPTTQQRQLSDEGVQFVGDDVDLTKTPAVFLRGIWQHGKQVESACRRI